MTTSEIVLIQQIDDTIDAEKSRLADHPTCSLSLYPFQLQSLERMRQIEANPTMVSEKKKYSKTVSVTSRVGMLTNKPGSGKSAIVLSLCETPCVTLNDLVSCSCNGFSNRVYSDPSEVIHKVKTNLIIVAPKLVDQWQSYLKQFDSLRAMVLRKVPEDWTEVLTILNQYQVLVLSVNVLHQWKPFVSTLCFDRLFFDEVDSLEFRQLQDMLVLHANFIWFVTATPLLLINQKCQVAKRTRLDEPLQNRHFKGYLQNLTNFFSHDVRTYFIVKCSDSVIDDALKLPAYTIENIEVPKSSAVRLLQDVMADHPLLQECLHGDQLPEAISLLQTTTGEPMKNLASAATAWLETIRRNLESERIFVESSIPLTEQQGQDRLKRLDTLTAALDANRLKQQTLVERIRESPDCSICREPLTNPLMVKCCCQIYCFECLDLWIKQKANCPMCRSEVKIGSVKTVSKKIKATVDLLTTKSHKSLLIITKTSDGQAQTVKEALEAANIQVYGLTGLTSSRCAVTIQAFMESPDKGCMIIHSTLESAGFNFPFVDTIVMYQDMKDREAQIIGRGMRPGRTGPLQVFRLLYT